MGIYITAELLGNIVFLLGGDIYLLRDFSMEIIVTSLEVNLHLLRGKFYLLGKISSEIMVTSLEVNFHILGEISLEKSPGK